MCKGIEDYLHLVRNLAETKPDLLFLSPAFPSAVQIAVTAVTLLDAHVCHDGIDTLRTIVGHDSLSSNPTMFSAADTKQASSMNQYAQAIRGTIAQPDVGGRLVSIILTRLVTDFHEDCTPMSITLSRLLAERFPQELAQWVPAAVSQISPKDLREPERQKFLSSFNEGLSTRNLGKVRSAFTNLDRATKKERERASLR
jgi:transportin-3